MSVNLVSLSDTEFWNLSFVLCSLEFRPQSGGARVFAGILTEIGVDFFYDSVE